MVKALSIEVDKPSERNLRRLEKSYPRHYWRAFAWAVQGALRQLKKGVRIGGGQYGIEQFAPKTAFTRKLEKVEGRERGWYGKIGAKSKSLTRWKEGRDQHIGWVSNVAKWAEKVETRDQHEMSGEFVGWLKHHGFERGEIPTWYNRPARDVITPFASFQRAGEFSKNVTGAVKKLMEQEVRKLEKVRAK